ncbi:MAG: response regulator [Candidatus Kapabacteria bacterium]|nr:response regulator [Candidatus Kapabacteria bacterium]
MKSSEGSMFSQPFHILVVDDQPIFRQVIGTLIREEGGRVTEAASAQEALHFLTNGLVIDGITTDYRMPVMNGIDFVKVLRAMPEYAHIPIAVVSTENISSIAVEAKKVGASIWIDKFSIVPNIPQWLGTVYASCPR